MKEFKILNIYENRIRATNQSIAVFEMVEIEYINLPFLESNKAFIYKWMGEEYVIDLNSELAKNLINKAQNEEIISLDLSEFRKRKENVNGQVVIRHFHKSIIFHQ